MSPHAPNGPETCGPLQILTYSWGANPLRQVVRASRRTLVGSRGPDSVVGATEVGLRSLSVPYVRDPKSIRPTKPLWIPSGSEAIEWVASNVEIASEVVAGPNLDLKDSATLASTHKLHQRGLLRAFLVPSGWVRDIFMSRHQTSALPIQVWPTGVDCNYWAPRGSNRNRVLVYWKSSLAEDWPFRNQLELRLGNSGLAVQHIQYGRYTRSAYRRALSHARAAIWLGGTESQGLALTEAWAMGVPTLVLQSETRYVFGRGWPASAAPYLSEMTGRFVSDKADLLDRLDSFIERVEDLNPRGWVLENQSAISQTGQLLGMWRDDS